MEVWKMFFMFVKNYENMAKIALPITEQIKVALDGRSQRWLALEIKMPETDLSKKMNSAVEFTERELTAIEERLNFKFEK